MSKLEFKISSEIKNILGRDLITNENVAIFELVKNSYDAHASKVIITFETDRIIIADNGKGMSLDDIKDKWLFLGFSAKKDGTEDLEYNKSYRDKIKRHYAGAKGIGRLSCDRIAHELILTTKSISSPKQERIKINWDDFEKDQRNEFGKIAINYLDVSIPPIYPDNSTTGTILELSILRSKWSRDNIRDLKSSLEKLINPFSETYDFQIEIVCISEIKNDSKESSERRKVNGIIKNSIIDVLGLKTTQIEVKLQNNEIVTTLFDRGIDIYKIKEKNSFYCLQNATISLYFLNRAAKINFNKKMGMQPVQYGSIFLFRNGFRILPFGDLGDDSWQLDFRNQQGYNRFLGTRDLFGRVDVITDDINEFKEVSSRDGGLINTKSAQQLFKFFEIAHRRLERYVVGVLWGEGFLKREYFNNEADALLQRKLLQENDKDSESVKYAFSNIGSKVDFVQLIKTLAKDPNIQVLYFNKDLADFVTNVNDSNLIKVQFISDLEKIASETNNSDLLFNIEEAKKKLEELQKEKEFAEERAKEEERKRIDAELKTKEAERARVYAEQKRQEEERARILAQLKAKEESQKAKEAELKHREEMIRRKEAEQKQKEEEAKRIEAEKERDAQKNKNQYLSSTRNITKEAEDIMHTILISSNELKAATEMIANIAKQLKNKTVHEQLEYLRFHIERINILSRLLTKADIVLLKASTKVDVKKYIKEYLINYNKTLEISFEEKYSECIIKKIPLLNLSVVLDNLISNSQKAGAKKLHISFSIKGEKTILVDFSDNGKGVDLNNFSSKTIFEEGVTNRIGGSGIGLSTIKDEMKKDLHGDIDFIGNGLFFKKGATFRLIFE